MGDAVKRRAAEIKGVRPVRTRKRLPPGIGKKWKEGKLSEEVNLPTIKLPMINFWRVGEPLVKREETQNPNELEEKQKSIVMERGEEEEWREKLLKERKTSHEPQQEMHIQPESWPERLKSSTHYFEKKVSLQVPMHPEMRKQVAALATSYGLGSGEFVEKILAEQLAKDSKRVSEGRDLIAQNQFKRPYRAKVQALRKEIEELRQEKSSQRS